MSAPRGSSSRIQKRKSGRPRPLPPEVNARNLAIEKQRREALNDKFLVIIPVRRSAPWTGSVLTEWYMQTLARLIPGLDTAQRLTKVLIVDESIRALEEQRVLYMAAMQDKQDLIVENKRLNMEITTLRSQTLNCCACSGSMGVPADPRLQLMDFYSGIENDWFRMVGNPYDLTSCANSSLMSTSVQSSNSLDVAEQTPQPCAQDWRLQGVFDM